MERLSRRGFLKAGVVAAGSIATGGLTGELIYPFSEIPFRKDVFSKKDFETALNLQGRITIPTDPYKESPDTYLEVTLNKKPLVKLYFSSLIRDSELALKASAILNKKPLKIFLTEDEPPQVTTLNGPGRAGASYTPILEGGPQITIYENFITSYYIAGKSSDIERQKEHDILMLHEFAHFLQDVRNPFRLPIHHVWLTTQELINKTQLTEPLATQGTELENEAQRKAEEDAFGPYGNLFNFQRTS